MEWLAARELLRRRLVQMPSIPSHRSPSSLSAPQPIGSARNQRIPCRSISGGWEKRRDRERERGFYAGKMAVCGDIPRHCSFHLGRRSRRAATTGEGAVLPPCASGGWGRRDVIARWRVGGSRGAARRKERAAARAAASGAWLGDSRGGGKLPRSTEDKYIPLL